MSRYAGQIVLTSFILLLFALPVWSQHPYVYLVKATGCTPPTINRALTGFRAQGIKGIVTALHGVADATTITVMSMDGKHGDGVVTISQIDIAHDLALLSSPEFERMPADGYVQAPPDSVRSGAKVSIVGYPLNIDAQDLVLPLMVGEPARKILGNLLDADTRLALSKRQSPQPTLSVIYLVQFHMCYCGIGSSSSHL
jgi:hypothetical protein